MDLKTVLVLLALAGLTGCLGGSSTNIDGILGEGDSRVSECGGFLAESSLDMLAQDSLVIESSCEQEKLLWWYDEPTRELKLLHTCVSLNCCGLREVSISLIDGIYQMIERDDPEPPGLRCDCICTFDFAVKVTQVAPATIVLRLRRTSEDYGDIEIWQGPINLLELFGAIII